MTADISIIEQELTAAIMKAVPGLGHVTGFFMGVDVIEPRRPITLDDICRALIAANEFTMTNFEKLFTHYIFGRPLNEQDDTAKRILHSILCNKD